MIDFHSVYERHAGDLYGFALYLSGNRTTAEDLVADAFVRLWTARGEIRNDTIKGYLLTIVRNLYFTSRRRAARQMPLDDEHVVVDVAASIAHALEISLAAAKVKVHRARLKLVEACRPALSEVEGAQEVSS